MTTRMLRAGVLGFVVSVVWTGCDGRTFIGSPGGGTGGNSGLGGGTGGNGGLGGGTGVQTTVDASVGDATIINGDPTTDATTTVVDATTTVVDATTTIVDASAACPPSGQANTPTTVAAMRAALSRDWLLCSPIGLFHRPQIGIRITADDHWAVLVALNADGTYLAATSADLTGTVQYIGNSGQVAVGFTSDAGLGGIISQPAVTRQPTMLIINNMGVEEYRYVLPDHS